MNEPDTVVLDAGGVLALAAGRTDALAVLAAARRARVRVSISGATYAEVVRGSGPRDAPVNRVLHLAETVPVTERIGRRAGLLLAAAGSSSTVEALVVATALETSRGAVVLTSDPDDIGRLARDHPTIRVAAV